MSDPHAAETGHPVLDVVARRWSPYAFDARPVSDGDLLRCLEAARWAASSFNEQPWRFIVAKREDAAAFEKAIGCLAEANRAWAANAGVLLLTAVRTTFSRNDKPNRVAVHDLGLAAAQLALQAVALGLQVHQMAGVDLDAVRTTYAVPEGFEPVTAIAIGHAADADSFTDQELAARDRGERRRKPLGEIVFAGTWGEAAPVTTG